MGTREYEWSRRGTPDKTEKEQRAELADAAAPRCRASARFGKFGGVIVCNQPLPCRYGHRPTEDEKSEKSEKDKKDKKA